MGWLDTIIEKGSQWVDCDPPWDASNDWPLRGKPPGLTSTRLGHEGEPYDPKEPMVPVVPDPNLRQVSPCKYWYTREYKHTSSSTGKWTSVAKWYNDATKQTQWTVVAGGLAYLQQDFPELYALLAPLPKNVKIEPDPDFQNAPPEEIEDYIKTIGSKDPDVPPEAKPPVTEQIKRAGFPLWLGLLIGGGVVGAIIYNARKKKGKGGKLAKRSRRPAWTR